MLVCHLFNIKRVALWFSFECFEHISDMWHKTPFSLKQSRVSTTKAELADTIVIKHFFVKTYILHIIIDFISESTYLT